VYLGDADMYFQEGRPDQSVSTRAVACDPREENMKKGFSVLALALLLMLAAVPAAVADPGNGNGWESLTAECDGGVTLDIIGHEGLWSVTHIADGSRLILTAQTVKINGEVDVDLQHPGHKNQEPDVSNCEFSFTVPTPDGDLFFEISLTGFIRP
jgi:hypothetical protein